MRIPPFLVGKAGRTRPPDLQTGPTSAYAGQGKKVCRRCVEKPGLFVPRSSPGLFFLPVPYQTKKIFCLGVEIIRKLC